MKVLITQTMPDETVNAFVAYIIGTEGNRGVWAAEHESDPPDQWLYYRNDDPTVTITPIAEASSEQDVLDQVDRAMRQGFSNPDVTPGA